MVEDSFSCIKEITRIVHIALPSVYISNEVAGVTEILESWKRQYIQQLQGVVVSYKNVSLTSNSGFIVIDKPFVHYDVKATFELFCPTIGSIVEGKINRVSQDYIGSLVHNTINVAIKRSCNVSDGLSKFIALDRIILFKITCFDFHRRVIRVKGEITQECVNLMKELPPFKTQSDIFQDSQSTYFSTSESSEDTTENNNPSYVDSDDQSQSLLLPNHSIQRDISNVYNVDHLGDTSCTGFPSSSVETDTSSLAANSHSLKKKSKKHKNFQKLNQKTDIEEPMQVDESIVDFKLPPKKKKKHSVKKLDKCSKETSRPKKLSHSKIEASSNKKKSKKDKYLSLLPESTTSDIETTDEIKSPLSVKKKKSLKKTCGIHEFLSPKLHVDVDSNMLNNFATEISIKKEIETDVESCSSSPKKKKKNNIAEESIIGNVTYSNLEDLTNSLSTFTLENQLQFTKALCSNIKEEPLETNKKGKKRKRESTSKDLPKKKMERDLDSSHESKNKSHLHKKGKNKKKDKEKSKKSSKKGRSNKPKDKLSKSKKCQLSYKIKSKKKKKLKDKKSKVKKQKSHKT